MKKDIPKEGLCDGMVGGPVVSRESSDSNVKSYYYKVTGKAADENPGTERGMEWR